MTTTEKEKISKTVIRYTRIEMEKFNKPEFFSSDFKLKLLDAIQYVAQAQSEALSASYERYTASGPAGGTGGDSSGGPPSSSSSSSSSSGPPGGMGRGIRGRGRGVRGAFRGGWGRGSYEESGDSSSYRREGIQFYYLLLLLFLHQKKSLLKTKTVTSSSVPR